MTDLRRTGKNNQRRNVNVLVAPFVEADILVAGSQFANLPANTLIQSATVLVKTASGTATATLDVVANGTVVANEVDVDDTGAKVGTIVEDAAYLATGGEIIVRAGAVTPADGALIGVLVMEYIELDKANGEYTN